MRINCYKEQKTKVILHKRLKYSFVDYLYISFDGNFELVCKKAHNRLSFTDCVLTFSVISLWRGAVCLAHPGKEGKGTPSPPQSTCFLAHKFPAPKEAYEGAKYNKCSNIYFAFHVCRVMCELIVSFVYIY